MIRFENEICEYLAIPSIPKKEWDKKSSFKHGAAVIQTIHGAEAFAVCSFDADLDETPRIIKVFDSEPFKEITAIFVVPTYMDVDVESADLDDTSKEAAKALVDEVDALIEDETIEAVEPQHEYFFDNINNDEEAIAFIKAYNKRNGIRGGVPSRHDTIVMRLGVIYSDMNKCK